MVRLQKYLAECGIASRRACEGMIEAGRVAVNGETAHVGQSIEPGTDQITVDGREIGVEEKIYVVLNKPTGFVTSAKDEFGRKTVLDCVRGARVRVFPVGRLDMDVEGVILLTNDGELGHRLIHPSFGVNKVYVAWVRGQVSETTLQRLRAGVDLEDGKSAPAEAVILSSDRQGTQLQLTLHEGRKREVKRMCEAVGHPIRKLRRIAFANIEVDGLRPGEWRYLTAEEIAELRALVRLAA